MIRRNVGIIFILLLSFLLFLPVFRRGHVPISTDFMAAWYEPFKTSFGSVDGYIGIVHKPVVDDAFRHLYPLRVIAARIMKSGNMPLWNPYNASGTPLLAILHPGYMTPFGIFFLLFSPEAAWTIYILLQPIVLGISMYWYMGNLGVGRRSAIFSAAVLLLSGFAVVRLEYGEFLYVLSGLPVLLGIVECLRKRMSLLLYAIPIVICIMMLSGQPHMNVYILSVFGIYTLIRLPFTRVITVAAWSILGVFLSAFQLLPSLELFSHSTINRHTSTFIFDRFLLPFGHLITIIIPNYFGNQATYNYFGPHDYTETVAYVGSIPVFFAVFAVWKNHSPVVRFFAILTVFSIATTVRWPGAYAFFSLPIPVLSADVPSRIFVLSTFAIAVLSGFGMSAWQSLRWSKAKYWVLGAGLFAAVIMAVTFVLYRLNPPCPPVLPLCHLVSVRTSSIELFGFVLFLIAAVFGFRLPGKVRRVILWIPIGLVIFLGLYNAQKFLPFSPREYVFPEMRVMSALKRESGFGRFISLGSARIRSNLTALYGLYSTEYFDPLHVGRYAELMSFVNMGDKKTGVSRSDVEIVTEATVSADLAFRRDRFLDMAGTNTILSRKRDNLEASTKRWEDEYWRVSTRPTAFPRAYLVTHLVIEPDQDRELAAIFSPKIHLRDTAFVEESIEGWQEGGKNEGTVHIDAYEPSSVTLTVESPTPAFLVLSDTYYPGWRAQVDGVDRTVYRTNYVLRGVVVPEGHHTVVFRYQPSSFIIGGIITLISILVWAAIYCYNRSLNGSVAKW